MMFINAGLCIKNKLMPVGQYQLSGPIKNFTWSTELCALWVEEINLGFWIHVYNTLIFLWSPQWSKYEKLFRSVVVWSTLFLLINRQRPPPPPPPHPTPSTNTHPVTQSCTKTLAHTNLHVHIHTLHTSHTLLLSLLHDGNAVDLRVSH